MQPQNRPRGNVMSETRPRPLHLQRIRLNLPVPATPLRDRALALNFPNNAPVFAIINGTHNLETDWANAGVSDDTLLAHAVQNFYDYGRANWTWVSTSHTGDEDLIRGAATKAFCAQFNNNFKEFAVKVLCFERTDFKNAQIAGQFVTKAGPVIDSKWKGNIMVDRGNGAWADYKILNVYAFDNHYFLHYKQTVVDVCTNRVSPVASQEDDMIWFKFREVQAPPNLLRTPGAVRQFFLALEATYNSDTVCTITQGTNNLALYNLNLTQAAWRLVKIDSKRSGNDLYFSTWLLTQATALSLQQVNAYKVVDDRERVRQVRLQLL